MSRRVALLDVNLLVALFDDRHVHHELAHDWFADNRARGWATCSVTENGFLRIASHLSPPADRLRPADLLPNFRTFCGSRGHHFWTDAVSIRDSELFNLSVGVSARHLTDVYLLGLAKRMNGALATFDRNIPLNAVIGGTSKLLEIIAVDEDTSA